VISISKEEAISKLKNLCSRKELCSFEIKEKLFLWQVNHNDFSEIIDNLKEENFVNDLRFAQAYIKDKLKFNKWGNKKLKYELKRKGIDDNFIEIAVSNIDYDEYSEIVKSEIIKKLKSIRETDLAKLKFKIINFSKQRGYEIELTLSILKEYFKNDGK
jgi:regulatory protein